MWDGLSLLTLCVIKRNEAIQIMSYISMDCFVVPLRNDAPSASALF